MLMAMLPSLRLTLSMATPNTVNGNAENWKPYHSLGQCWYASVGIKYFFN